MKAAGKEIKIRITEVGAGMASTSVNEGSWQRNQAKDYGSESRNSVYFRKSEAAGKGTKAGISPCPESQS